MKQRVHANILQVEGNSLWTVPDSTPLWSIQPCFWLSLRLSFSEAVSQGGVSCQQTHAVQLFSESIAEVRLSPCSYSEACLLILKRRRWRAMNPFNYLLLGEHGSGNANGTFFKYPFQETAWTKVWILILRGSSQACQSVDSKDTLPQHLQSCPPLSQVQLIVHKDFSPSYKSFPYWCVFLSPLFF